MPVKTDFTDGTILSGAMVNSTVKELMPRFTVPVVGRVNEVLGSGTTWLAHWVNDFGVPVKCIGAQSTASAGTPRWESPQGNLIASGNYIGAGATVKLYMAADPSANPGNIQAYLNLMISGWTINGV